MILREFPDLQWLKKQAEDSFADRKTVQGNTLPVKGWPNVILNVVSENTHRNNIRGPLSIFTNMKGKSVVTVDQKRSVVREGFFYISNHDQYYTLDIEAEKTETLNIHFGEYFADQVWQSCLKNNNALLEDTFQKPANHFEFHNKLHLKNEKMDVLLLTIQAVKNPSSLWLEEKLSELILLIIDSERSLIVSKNRTAVLKSSTRDEIFKRLMIAVDYMYSYYEDDITLDDLAAVSCLSKFHFLRLFKQAYQKTPHQFLCEIKMKRSKVLLQEKKTIKTVAETMGFKDASSFSRMFRQHVGVYPTQFLERRFV